jgi:hypothetical protein
MALLICHSDGVKAIIEDLKIQALAKMPQEFSVEVQYRTRADPDEIRTQIEYFLYKGSSQHTNPDFSAEYDTSTRTMAWG